MQKKQRKDKHSSSSSSDKKNSSSDSVFDSHSSDDESSEFIVKNGCCKDCMKAFSKHGKVSIQHFLYVIRVVYAKCLACKEDRVYHLLMAANSVVAMVATR